jgi:hypothetical protein
MLNAGEFCARDLGSSTIPMDRWVVVNTGTGEEFKLHDFVGDSVNCPGVPVGHTQSSAPFVAHAPAQG